MKHEGRAMAEEATRPRLGRGLAALIGDMGDETAVVERARGQRRVPVEFLRPNPRNPRKRFAEFDLDELAASIRQRGIVQPIVVRPLPDLPDAYEIVAGERRWRAAQRAGLHEVPIVVVEVDDKTSLEFAIIENVQRADLNPIEEATGYERLMSEFKYTQEEVSKLLGRSRSHVANTLRLLALPPSVQAMLIDSRITPGHARSILAVKDPEGLAKRVVEKGLTVRDVERIAHAENDAERGLGPEPRPRRVEKDPDTRALEKALEDVLGLVVAIEHRGQGGELRIRYQSLEQLDGLCRRLNDAAAR
jgi:ParB family transcriptional regulator, chromosome partitioning protein